MRVRHDEGVAIHIGPKPCVGIREGAGEASAGEGIGQPLSRERSCVSGADAFQIAEGDTDGRVSASARTARRGRGSLSTAPWDLACADAPWMGTGRSHVWLAMGDHCSPRREGEEP